MKRCEYCGTDNPPAALYCMRCGERLNEDKREEEETDSAGFSWAGMNAFMLSVVGSIAVSLLLMLVFGMPVFLLAAFLPLLWKKRD